jgi:hypothetical protein
MYTIKGSLKSLGEELQVSEKFKKRDFVLVDNSSQYPQFLSFQLTQDKVSLMDNIKEGEEITVYFNLRGREWTSPQNELKYFNTLEAWKIEAGEIAAPKKESKKEVEDEDVPF